MGELASLGRCLWVTAPSAVLLIGLQMEDECSGKVKGHNMGRGPLHPRQTLQPVSGK